jgi:hypothetical protein
MTVGPAYPANPGYPAFTGYPTLGATTTSPTSRPTVLPPRTPGPTPSHAARCTGEPTGPQILALAKTMNGVPPDPLRVQAGPFCSAAWSLTTLEVTGKDTDQVEPLMVVATGKGSTLAPVALGQDVCNARVQRDAPPGIRVLACGF